MFHEVDHVLELVRERHSGAVPHVRRRVRTAERSAGIGDDRVEDLAVIELGRERRIEIAGKEESGDEAARKTARLADELVDDVRHQHDYDGVRIDVGNVPERRCVEWIESRVEQLLQ